MSKGQTKGLRLVYGRHSVKAALESGRLAEMYIAEDLNPHLAAKAADKGVRVERVSANKLNSLTGSSKHQGVAGYCRSLVLKGWKAAIEKAERPLLVVLDQVQDPHNLGACLRTAAAFGAQAIVHPKRNSVGLTPAARKVASGAEEVVTVDAVTNLARELLEMQKQGLTVIGTVTEGGTDITKLDLSGPVALVLGGEGGGIRDLTAQRCDQLASIELPGAANMASLNVSVSCGICLAAAVLYS